MRKGIVLVFGLLVSAASFAQIQDTAALRQYINTRIIPNGNRSITAQNLNDVLNGYLNAWPSDSLSLSPGSPVDTLILWKRGKQAANIYIKDDSLYMDSLSSRIDSVVTNFAPINNPVFTGLVIAPTPTNSGKGQLVATTGFVQNMLNAYTPYKSGGPVFSYGPDSLPIGSIRLFPFTSGMLSIYIYSGEDGDGKGYRSYRNFIYSVDGDANINLTPFSEYSINDSSVAIACSILSLNPGSITINAITDSTTQPELRLGWVWSYLFLSISYNPNNFSR